MNFNCKACQSETSHCLERTKENHNGCSSLSLYSHQMENQQQESLQEQYRIQQIENQKLRAQVLDMHLKEREYVSKITELQISLAKLDKVCQNQKSAINLSLKKIQNEGQQKKRNSLNRQEEENKENKEEKKFCQIVVKTYQKMFKLTNLKQIWKKHKSILEEWVLIEK